MSGDKVSYPVSNVATQPILLDLDNNLIDEMIYVDMDDLNRKI